MPSLERVGNQVAMRQTDASGLAGGAAGIRNHGQIGVGHIDGGRVLILLRHDVRHALPDSPGKVFVLGCSLLVSTECRRSACGNVFTDTAEDQSFCAGLRLQQLRQLAERAQGDENLGMGFARVADN